MHINTEKILVHANEELAVVGPETGYEEQIERFRRFLKVETERLKIRHRFGLGGGEITSGRSYLTDLIICRACQLAVSELGPSDPDLNNCALIALGGYGRQDLAPFSDVDLLFLYPGKQSRIVKEFAERILYMLWDIGFNVGHSFRSMNECVTMAKTDLHSRNAMSEARLVTGNAHLFRQFTKRLDEAVFRNKKETEAFFEVMKSEIEARYAKFGGAVCLQEPNVKESAGGLRDLHTVLWIGHARYGSRGLDDLRAKDRLSGAEYASARRAYDFIARARNEAHFATGRKTDLLTLDLQPKLAASFGYEPKRGMLASELFMRDYYQRANELHRFAESFVTRAVEMRDEKRGFGSRVKRIRASFEFRQGKVYLSIRKVHRSEDPDSASFELRQGRLHLKEEPDDFRSNPLRLMEIFSVAQSERADLSDELKMTVRDNLSLIDRGFRASTNAGLAFVEILEQKGHVTSALRLMHETGVLGRLLPEFARITFLVQHDFYHKYTIDEHTLKAVEALDHLATEKNSKLARFARVFDEVENAAPLYLGLLFHDIGKGHGTGHVARGVRIAERACRRLSLDQLSCEQVVFLVRQHLLMSHISQRRDLSEEKLVETFSSTVGSVGNLNMLLLLTYADINGVGPGVWSDWKGELLWELYTRARAHMTGGRRARWDRDRAASLKQQVMREMLPSVLPSEVERHFAMLPERYLRANRAAHIARHLRLIKRMGAEPLIADWRTTPDGHCTELTICGHDSTGLFAAIAGTLTAHGINILSADLNTREDGLVIDTFKVCEVISHEPVAEERLARVQENLRAAVEGKYEVAAAIEKWRSTAPRRSKRRRPVSPAVHFDSDVSSAATVIEVRAEDEPGLAYKIASCLTGLGLNITFAKIATEKSHALDVFYVTDTKGKKLAPTEMLDVESALVEALGGSAKSK